MLMGGGGSFSAGGPGKGMHSRLCESLTFILLFLSSVHLCYSFCLSLLIGRVFLVFCLVLLSIYGMIAEWMHLVT